MDRQTKQNDAEIQIDGVNQRNAPLTKDMNWQDVENITSRQGKKTRIEGKRLVSFFLNAAVVNVVGFGDKVIIQTTSGIYLNDL